MKKIIITNESIMSAEGKRNNRNCKPVFCITTGEVFTSGIDAAKTNNVTPDCISLCCTGKMKTTNGKRFCFVADMSEHYEEIARTIRVMYSDYLIAEEQRREDERKAEEKRKEEARLAREQKRIDKARENYAQRCAKYNKARSGVEKAKEELVALGVIVA